MKILVVDDNRMQREMLRGALSKFGHQVDVACGAEEALAVLPAGGHRLVITDWEMPGMDGPDLCRAIRRAGLPRYTYLILLTIRGGKDRVEGLSAGADDFITKPPHIAEMELRIRGAERLIALESREVMIFTLAKLAESRDPETGEHLERVRRYVQVLAADLSRQPEFSALVDAGFVRMVYLTSPLHDIGKVAIPDAVLLKPGKLTDVEFAIMRTHTTHGAHTLEAAAAEYPDVDFLRMARDIALTHHERFDGGGYPNGLLGEQIPLCGRIVAVADVYDALTSKRIYKPAMDHPLAVAKIIEASGRHFDPRIVEALRRCAARFLEIRNQFADHPIAPVEEAA